MYKCNRCNLFVLHDLQSIYDLPGSCYWQETHFSATLQGRNSGHIQVWVYGPRIWLLPPETTLGGTVSQPAYIFHSHGNGLLDPPRGGNVPGHGSRGATSWPETMPTLGSPGRISPLLPVIRSLRWMEPAATRPMATGCQPASCPSSSSNLEADRLHRGPDWRTTNCHGHVLCARQHTLAVRN